MTKKDFEVIARALADARPSPDERLWPAMSQWKYTVGTMAQALFNTNPAFDRKRFVDACNA